MKLFQRWRIRKPETDDESVYISERFGVRSLHIGSDTVQSAMRLARPNDLELSYTRSMMAFLLFHADPRAILMIGLGAGSLAKFIYHRLPTARTVAVEINPRIVTVARQHFGLPAEDERFEIVVGDGSAYLADGVCHADVVMVDGYDAQAQVAELATQRFYGDCFKALNAGGILVVNLWGGDRGFRACVERIASAFGNRILSLPAGRPGNVVVMGMRDLPAPTEWSALRKRARKLEESLGLEFTRFVEELRKMNAFDAQGLLLPVGDAFNIAGNVEKSGD
jgi:spermidine synthase